MNFFCCKLIFIFCFGFAKCQSDTTNSKYHYNKNLNYNFDTLSYPKYNIDSLILNAKSYIGTHYIENGKNARGFDCSGFMFFIHQYYGIYLPYNSYEYADIGVEIDIKNVQKGDFILFKGFDIKAKQAGHVGLIISEKDAPIQFIHSSTSKGIRIDVLKGNKYFEPRFLFVKRIVD